MEDNLKHLADLHDENIELKKEIEESYINGVLTGLKICKKMWAQGTISHENTYENEVYYKEQLKDLNANVKKLKTEREWISVKDRLPEVGIVLAFKNNEVYVSFFDGVTKPAFTHYMPLPDKPKQ